MTIHCPGLPEDLPDPNLLWTRWAAFAVATADNDDDYNGYLPFSWGLHFANYGSTWMGMARYDGGRFVLFGEDEASDTKWHKPPIDVLAEAPAWLPFDELRPLVADYMIGFIYWYENDAWHRAPYPETLSDDGLDCAMGSLSLSTSEDAASILATSSEDLDPDSDGSEANIRLRFLKQAEQGTVTSDALDKLAEHIKVDIAELTSLAQRLHLIDER